MHPWINGLVVIRLSIKVYNPAAAGLILDSLVISAGHASAATGVGPTVHSTPESHSSHSRRLSIAFMFALYLIFVNSIK
jgi:hypothetical protein